MEGNTCDNVKSCFITLLRLSFYDGTGFDYFQGVVNAGLGTMEQFFEIDCTAN